MEEDENERRKRPPRSRNTSDDDCISIQDVSRHKKPKKNSTLPQTLNSFEGFNLPATTYDRNLEENVIIVKPTPDQSKSFFSDNIKIFRLLQKSQFGKAGILENKRNLKNMTQIVKVKSSKLMEKLLKIKKLGDFDVECSLPASLTNDRLMVGVIGPFGLDTKTEDLLEIINSDPESKIKKVTRLMSYKNKTPSPTNLMKIWIQDDQLPDYVILMAERFRVRPFIQKAIQCFKCQGFGHFASVCTRQQSCVLCSGRHRLSECPNKESEVKKCKNCHGNHTSNYSQCPFMIKENKIQRIKSENSLTYRDAVLKYENTKKTNTNLQAGEKLDTNHTVSNNNVHGNNSRKDKNIEKVNPIDDKFLAFILEIVCGLKDAQNLESKCELISKSYKHYFNKYYETNEIKKAIKGRISLEGTLEPDIING